MNCTTNRILTLCSALALCALSALPACAEELKIGAGAAPSENVLKPVKPGFEKATGITLSIISTGPKAALQDLVEKGSVHAAAAGLTKEDWLALMKKEGAEVKNPDALQFVTIGKDRIIVMTHKSNPVKSLSKEQLQGIFTGAISNWKEVGGADQPILVVWGMMIPGTNAMFSKHIMEGKAVTKEILEANTAVDIKQSVQANPEAIGIGPVALLDDSVATPEVPEIARPIMMVTSGAPSPSVAKLIDYIKGEGQKVIK
jgi:phosphate transport system substrate-binding protein